MKGEFFELNIAQFFLDLLGTFNNVSFFEQGRNGSECSYDALTIMEGSSSALAAASHGEANDTAVIGKFCGAQGRGCNFWFCKKISAF